MENDSAHRTAALAFLKANSLGALATISPDGAPHVRLQYYACDDSFALYFLTLANTRKVVDIHANAKAAFVVSSPDKHHTLQIEGTFVEMTDTATFGPMLSSLAAHLFPEGEESAPVAHLDTAHPAFFKLAPSWIRWGDFTHEGGTKESLFEIDSAV